MDVQSSHQDVIKMLTRILISKNMIYNHQKRGIHLQKNDI